MDEEHIIIDEEGAETEEDLGRQDPSIYSKAVVWGTDWTAETIVNQLRRKNIDLNPDFQRRDAWDPPKKSKFIESLLLGLPVPPIILAEKKNKKNSYLVIDGKQRLLSIVQFCTENADETFKQLFLTKLEILSDLNGRNYNSLDGPDSLTDYRTQFDNQTIRTIVIRNWPNETFLYTVFLRLNTGSMSLSPQELRQALHPGEFLVYANRYSEESRTIQDVLNITKPDPRMRDVDLIVRYFAFKNYLKDYGGHLKDFLDNSCKRLNEDWSVNKERYELQTKELENAIDFTTSIFEKKHRFSKFIGGKYTNTFNRTIFDIMVYYFSDPSIREKCANKKESVKHSFETLMTDNKDFEYSVGAASKDLVKTIARYQLWGNTLNTIIG